jgi:DNA-directed RNA polymerase specialized sigma24 family protein
MRSPATSGSAGGIIPARVMQDEQRSTEWALVSRAREGDLAAFEALYRQHVRRVYALCLRLSGNVALAEELTQEAFVRAWKKLAQFRGESAFSTWLHPLAVNVALAERRSRRSRETKPTRCRPARCRQAGRYLRMNSSAVPFLRLPGCVDTSSLSPRAR